VKATKIDGLRGLALLKSEVGASLVEYSMLIAMIAIVAVISITAVGSATAREFDCVGQKFGGSAISELVDEKEHDGHWHALSPEEEDYARACLDGVLFKPNARA
jgi:Flp pilus assembly pilin Flp